jgi:hypothetical protein
MMGLIAHPEPDLRKPRFRGIFADERVDGAHPHPRGRIVKRSPESI